MPFLMTSLGYIRDCVFMQQIEGFPLVWCMKSATVKLISLKLNLWTRFDNLIGEDTKWQSYHCVSEKDCCILMPSLKVSRRRYIPSKSKTKCLVFYIWKKSWHKPQIFCTFLWYSLYASFSIYLKTSWVCITVHCDLPQVIFLPNIVYYTKSWIVHLS